MAQAKTLTKDLLQQVAESVATSSARPAQDAVLFALSFRAGLRACEIAGVRWRDVLTAAGTIVEPGQFWMVPDNISKKGAGRRIPMHPELYGALVEAKGALSPAATKPNKTLILKPMTRTGAVDPKFAPWNADSVRKYMAKRFDTAGVVGCTSHSGRRTFITELARRANRFECSLRDVQKIAGHKDITTTERYVDLSDRVGELVGSL